MAHYRLPFYCRASMRILSLCSIVFTVAVAACGGGSDKVPSADAQETTESQYLALLQEAQQQKVEAIRLASDGPCSSDNQCSTLSFREPLPPCYFVSSTDYSLVSPTAAAASAAAANYDSLAKQAEAIAPPSNVSGSCFVNSNGLPLICLENRCQRGMRIGGPG